MHGQQNIKKNIKKQKPLPGKTQQSQEKNIHSHSGIRTHNPGKRAAASLRLRPCDQW